MVKALQPRIRLDLFEEHAQVSMIESWSNLDHIVTDL